MFRATGGNRDLYRGGRTAVVCILAAMVLSGCYVLSDQGQAEMSALAEKNAALKVEYESIRAKIKSGDITAADGLQAMIKVNELIVENLDEQKRVAAEHGTPAWVYWTVMGVESILVVFAGGKYLAAFRTVRGIVGKIHEARKNKGNAEDVVDLVADMKSPLVNAAAASMPKIRDKAAPTMASAAPPAATP